MCLFYNLKGQYPDDGTGQDQLLMICIRRANLDAFWARERSTVAKNRAEMASFLHASSSLGIAAPLPHRGPFPVGDRFGFATACAILVKSCRAGHNADQIEFETAHKVCSMVANYIHTTPGGTGLATAGSGDRSGMFFSGSPTNGLWFKRYLTGCHRRIGNIWIPDRAITVEIILGLLELLEEEYHLLETGQRRLEVCSTAALIVTGYSAALQGEEIPQIDVGMLWRY
ncbi:hypothetical protein ACA910_002166 [Epithemia clementina (nom. ined.)]